MSSRPSWDDLQQRQSGPAPSQAAETYDEICATVLSGSAGERFLQALRQRFLEARENPLGTEAELRMRVTQQQFVRDLEAARDRGVAARDARRKTS
jgi:hypothetical protein